MKKIPLRTCCVTREKCEKRDLIRIVRMPSGEVKVDLTGKLNGRGAYIKKELDVLKIAKEKKILEKHLEIAIDDSVYETIEKVINS